MKITPGSAFRCLPLALLLFFSACKNRTPEPPSADTVPNAPVVVADTPPADPAAEEPEENIAVYKGPRERPWDLLHTGLRVSFDWDQRRLQGQAELQLTPLFYDQQRVRLDARGFEIQQVQMNGQPLSYDYDLRTLDIPLPRTFSRSDTLQLRIDYTARPYEMKELGLEEWEDDHGLYFINPRNKIPNKPQQIWTQGEMEANSCWFPTFDQPNERCTQEMFMEVEDRFVTLSNGRFVGSEKTENGTRVDHWKMDQPHAPYLFMMAVGEFAVVKDSWRDIPVNYYVESEYEPYARQIFGNTPEMLEFFSTKLGYVYPFDKYSQVVVRDFVSGAMENTTATIHFEGLQQDDREMLDYTLEEFVSHELFHQWFGDVVTCESWAQLTLNEAFATYGEFLWIEHKYGRDEADWHFQGDRRSYLGQASYEIHPLIHFAYDDKNDMFDAHSYQKGGQILHMLRKTVGDEAFFGSIQTYLERHAFSDVEADELRLAFEDVTGRDLKWFFDQWFFSAGHPQLTVQHVYEDGDYLLRVQQTQSNEVPRVFRFPVAVDVAMAPDGAHDRQVHWVETRDTTLLIAKGKRPYFVDFNADGALLAEVEEEQGMEMLTAQFNGGTFAHQRLTALRELGKDPDQDAYVSGIRAGLKDEFWGVVRRSLGYLRSKGKDEQITALREELMALFEHPKAYVRSSMLSVLNGRVEYLKEAWADEWQAALIQQVTAATNDRSYEVQQNALVLLYGLSPEQGLARARALEAEATGNLVQSIAVIYARANAPDVLTFVQRQLDLSTSSRTTAGLMDAYRILWVDHERTDGIPPLKKIASENAVWWVRMNALRILNQFPRTEDLQSFFQQRLEAEQDYSMVVQTLETILETEVEGE